MQLSKLTVYLRPYRKHCIIGPLFKLTEAILELYLPVLMARVIDKGVKTGDVNYIYKMGGIMLLIVMVGLGCALICQYVASIASQGFGTELRNALFAHIVELSHKRLDEFGTPSLINRVTNDINQLQYAVAMIIRLVIRAPFLCIGGIIMAMIIDIKLSLIIILAIPLFVLVISLVMRATVKLYGIVQKKLDKLSMVLRENLSGIRVIRAFARTEQEQKRFSESVEEHTNMAIRVGRLSAFLNPATQLIMNAAILAIVWFGGARIETGGMTTGEIIAFINYVNQILLALIVVANLVITFTKAYASAGRVIEVFNTESEVTDKNEKVKEVPGAPAVTFSHVSFTYGDGEDELTDIHVKIPRGAMVGVIGGTGSGKSTLINLIPRFYDVCKGSILVDGVDVREYPLEQLRSKIGLVSQKADLFSGTIGDNIRWGKECASDEEVRFAAETAQAAEFINRMKDGYNTLVERGGANLSGGQRQRLTIARALVRNPEILILDDSFSALDYATDADLRKAICKNIKGITVFMISQRISTVKQADSILVMDDGKLAGAGTHEDLLKTCEVYKEIYVSQEQGKEAK